MALLIFSSVFFRLCLWALLFSLLFVSLVKRNQFNTYHYTKWLFFSLFILLPLFTLIDCRCLRVLILFDLSCYFLIIIVIKKYWKNYLSHILLVFIKINQYKIKQSHKNTLIQNVYRKIVDAICTLQHYLYLNRRFECYTLLIGSKIWSLYTICNSIFPHYAYVNFLWPVNSENCRRKEVFFT